MKESKNGFLVCIGKYKELTIEQRNDRSGMGKHSSEKDNS